MWRSIRARALQADSGMPRQYIDCRDYPSENHCSLKISGEPDEVIKAALERAISTHGEKDSPELREQLARSLKEEKLESGRPFGLNVAS